MDLVTDNLGYDVWDMEDIPSGTTSTIWILGESFKYEELDLIRKRIFSIFWITYRKGFTPIGPSVYQYTSDKGEKGTKRHEKVVMMSSGLLHHQLITIVCRLRVHDKVRANVVS